MMGMETNLCICAALQSKQAARVATQYAPAPLLRGRTSASRAAEQTQRTVLYHAEYVPTLTDAAALRIKAAVRKAAWWLWSLTFWPWMWWPSHV